MGIGVFLLALAAARAGETAAPLDRVVSLDLWGAGLNDVAREIQAQTGVEVLFYRHDLPADQDTDNLYLVAGGVSLRTVMECLARRYAFRYRVSRAGRLELSRSYDWAGGTPELAFQRLDDITPGAGGDLDDARRLVGEFVKCLPLLPDEYNFAIEKDPIRDSPKSLQSVIALPPVLSAYLRKAILCLGGEPGDYPFSGERGRENLHAVAQGAYPDMDVLLRRQIAVPEAGNLREILVGVAAQSGLAFILASPGGAQGRGLESGRIGVGRVCEELSVRFGLGRRVFLAAGAVSFESGAGDPWERDERSRELFWDGLAVAGFDARSAAERAGGGAALTSRLRSGEFSSLWRDPVCSLAYSEVTGRLAVIAPANVVEEIARTLGTLALPSQ